MPDTTTYSPADVIAKIAEVSAIIGFHANEGAMDMAGLIVSVLNGNPALIPMFMEEGAGLFFDGTIRPENGTLTYRAINGKVVSPEELREHLASKGIRR